MGRRRKMMMLFFSLSQAVRDFITRVTGDGGTVVSPKCIGDLDGSLVMYPSGGKAGTLYSQVPVPIYGPELVVNGGFDADTDWIKTPQSIISNGTAKVISNDGSFQSLKQSGYGSTQGKTVKISIDILSNVGVGIKVYFSGGTINTSIPTTIGTHTVIVLNDGTIGELAIGRISGIMNCEFDNVSVKEVLTSSADFTVARNSTATYTDKNGVIQTALANVPRFDYSDGSCPVLLTEPQSTNLITYSEVFSEWIQSNTVITPNLVPSPDGNLTADLIQSGGINTFPRVYQSISASGTCTFSTYCKKFNKDTFQLYLVGTDLGVTNELSVNYTFDFSTKTLTSLTGSVAESTFIEELNNGWFRIGITASSTTITQVRIYTDWNVTSTLGIYLWGAQLEQLSYPTSYIPTTATTATRVAEVCNGAGDVNTFNSEEGVLYAEISALADDDSERFISISDGTSTNRIYMFYYSAINGIAFSFRVSGVNQIFKTIVLTDDTAFNKIAFKYKLNDFSIWINGTEVHSDITGIVPPINTFDRFNLNDGAGLSPFYGKTKALAVFNTALVDDELEYLTTNGNLPSWTTYDAMALAFNYTIK